MSGNLIQLEKALRKIAKHSKTIKYTKGLLFAFIMMGMSAFSAEVTIKDKEIEQTKTEINDTVKDLKEQFRIARAENDKLLRNANLELIQLMEQGDQVVKSEWSSWQFGANYYYNSWNGVYKGRGDKAEKYPYEGIFTRSKDPFERYISTESEMYSLLSTSTDSNSASSNARKGLSSNYGIASTTPVVEPIVSFNVNAAINPRNIDRRPITLAAKNATLPTLPPTIEFAPPTPIVNVPGNPVLPTPPTFNIQLGSYCNNMTGCGIGVNGRAYNASYHGFAKSYSGTRSISDLTDGSPSLRHSWNETGNVLLKSYFDFTGGGTTTLYQNVTIDSINSLTDTEKNSETTASRTYNNQNFLVGGSRVATMDNVSDGSSLTNNATVNLVGPLVIGFEMQTDNLGSGTRTISNNRTITDAEESGMATIGGVAKGGTATLNLAPLLGGGTITVNRDSNGYMGYKVGLILTYEDNDVRADSNYILTNTGTIDIRGEKSIGIQIFAPRTSSQLQVKNNSNSTITMGGIESYGLKLSSRVSSTRMEFSNLGTINISGGDKSSNSLSSGMAVIENASYTGSNSIRAYTGVVKNIGTINVSGGKGNTGMVLIVNAPDNITNENAINVSGTGNIGMRVDRGTTSTDSNGTPTAINTGTITLNGESIIGISGTVANVTNNGTITSGTVTKSIGLSTVGGRLENNGTVTLNGSGDSNNIGIFLNSQSYGGTTLAPSGVLGSTSSIKVTGDNSTGILIDGGANLNYTGSTTVEGNGISGIVVTGNSKVTGTAAGTLSVNKGSGLASGLGKSGSYGMVVKNGSTFDNDKVNVDINVTSKESIGLYSNGTLKIGNHAVKADNGAVNYFSDNRGVLTLSGTGTSTTGQKSLLFYLGTTAGGKININGNMTATVSGGTDVNTRGTAFYYVGNGYTSFTSAGIKKWANDNFGGTLGNLTLNMEAGSRLFIAQDVAMNLSNTTGTSVSVDTGAIINGTGYKTFMLYLSKLSVDESVDLDKTDDAYNQLEIANSSIENNNNNIIKGSKIGQTAMAQENNSALYTRNKVELVNNGTISLLGNSSTGMYAKFGVINNAGIITISDNSTGVYGTEDSILSNTGKITIGSNSTGMYSEGSTTTNLVNAGTIESSGNGSIGLLYKPGTIATANAMLINTGIINMTGDQNVALYGTNMSGVTSTYGISNSGTITMGNSSSINNPNVALYADGDTKSVSNSGTITMGANTIGMYGHEAFVTGGSLTLGDGGVGIYSQSKDVTLSGGTITVGGNEAVGVYTVGSGQNIINSGTAINIGNTSFGFVNVGSGNSITSSLASNTLGTGSIYIYSNDSSGTVTNSTNLTSTGNQNYGIYSAGTVNNSGNMDLSSGVGNVGIYSVSGGTATNTATISVGGSDVDNEIFGIGMAAGFKGDSESIPIKRPFSGNIINSGIINVNGKSSIGMYATGSGSTVTNNNTINLNANNTTGIFLDNGATGINNGTITTGSSSGLSNVVGVYLGKDSVLVNSSSGSIIINATNGIGAYLKGGKIVNSGTITVTGAGAQEEYKFEVADTSKGVGGIEIDTTTGSAIIKRDGVQVTPVSIVTNMTEAPKTVSASSIGIYIDTSGISFTNPINGLGKLTSKADLIVGAEAAEYTTSKEIIVTDKNIIKPYEESMKANPQVTDWSIYSGSLTWTATGTLDPGGYLTGLAMAKIPYTKWAGSVATPVESTDTYNFLDGLEQRYGVEGLGTTEKALFDKISSIGNNEEILLYQAIDEMMGHQYANTQQRINATGNVLDKEFNYLRKEWETASKDSNKVKVFGMKGEYNTDTAGIIDYKNDAYGVAYLHEDETVKLGANTGWYAGVVHNIFKFKDIGGSREETTMGKLGIFKTTTFDNNGSLKWNISGEGMLGYSEMNRRFLVVDEIFGARSTYTSYGLALRNELSKEIRLSERTSLKPYGSIDIEYGRYGNIKEETGEVRLEVKGNDYYSIKPEVGIEYKYKQPMFVRTNLTASIGIAYENELGKVNDADNKARVAYTNADYFNLRGEKENREGNVKGDLKLGIENSRIGFTLDLGYDTKGENLRGGLGIRVIY